MLAGKSVTIEKAGKPLVDLVLHQDRPAIIGALRGQLEYDDETFDDPDSSMSSMFYGDP
ncbi:prevent-host-death protein [Paenarthrobacter sp. PH39-S1]|uniref:prevent-host-death protein n=1 Tax=Paenarthrobacter sp. PH39-S1 TaxID=3046204 RepID=UPI0024BA2921|nr:prevent-host-death protein [Paenarthrobacter sp. PH39-S1]MDJ0357986.1 prevent-host-death protein [Paenarthrobacter sp. PH39-S1]